MVDTTAGPEVPAVLGMVPRALTVLRYLAGQDRPAGVSEIARNTSLPKTTTHRLLGVLVRHGALRRSGTGYVVDEDGGWPINVVEQPNWTRLRLTAKPYLVELLQRTGNMASLAVLRNGRIRYLDSVYTHTHFAEVMHMAEAVPLPCTAAGLLLLAHSTDDAVPANDSTAPDPALLAQVREKGIARGRDIPSTGSTALAAPIFDRQNRVIAALDVAGVPRCFDGQTVEIVLRHLAHSLSRDIRVLCPPNRQFSSTC